VAVDGAIVWMRILAMNQYNSVKSEQTCIQYEDFLRASLRFSDRSERLMGEPSFATSSRTWWKKRLERGEVASPQN